MYPWTRKSPSNPDPDSRSRVHIALRIQTIFSLADVCDLWLLLLGGNCATWSTNCTARLTRLGRRCLITIMQLSQPQWWCCVAALWVPNRLLHSWQCSGEWNAGSVQDGDKQPASDAGQVPLCLQPARLQPRAHGCLPHSQRTSWKQTCLHQVTTAAPTGWPTAAPTGWPTAWKALKLWEFDIGYFGDLWAFTGVFAIFLLRMHRTAIFDVPVEILTLPLYSVTDIDLNNPGLNGT